MTALSPGLRFGFSWLLLLCLALCTKDSLTLKFYFAPFYMCQLAFSRKMLLPNPLEVKANLNIQVLYAFKHFV